MKAFRNEKEKVGDNMVGNSANENGNGKLKRLPMKLRFNVLNRLQEVLIPSESEKGSFADYKPDFSDKVIGDEFGISPLIVAGSRREVFGNFSPKKTSRAVRKGSTADLEQQLTELRSRIRYIERSLGVDETEKEHELQRDRPDC